MESRQLNILLADDDINDCLFFKEALIELPISTKLYTVNNGEQLMKYLDKNSDQLADVLFLDLNMPKKNGFECITEIKGNEKLKQLIIVMYSASSPKYANYERKLIAMLHQIEGLYYIRKPDKFGQLKLDIFQALKIVAEKKSIEIQNNDLFIT